jgi:hypothetical protein
MFRSKTRPIIIPQSEHARLAGLLAHLWGNNDIAPPPIDHTAFTLGVNLHDRGYGLLDAIGIGEIDDNIWLATQQHGIEASLTDPIADAVALMHIRRLLSISDHSDMQNIIERAEVRITETIARTPYNREAFEQADTITRTCDMISFRFCFEESVTFEETVFSHGDMIEIQIHNAQSGQVQLDPWPLSIPEVRGFIIGYELSGYPDHLQPVLVEFVITP